MEIVRNPWVPAIQQLRKRTILWRTGWMMIVNFLVCLILMSFDSRQITGVNAWLKPSKFAISSAMTLFSMAWVTSKITSWPGWNHWISRLFAVAMAIDVAIIDLQAARGTTSHFNMATRFDRSAYIVMGSFIAVLWLSMAVITILLFRQSLPHNVQTRSLRLGLLLSLLGAASGGLMVPPTHDQTLAPIRHQAGAHTVGAPDGSPGLPLTNWSRQHGDLRVAHFLGLHAIQLLPLWSLWISRRRSLDNNEKVRLANVFAVIYLAVVILLANQALRGQALLRPDSKTLLLVFVIVSGAVVAFRWAIGPRHFSRWFQVLGIEI